MLNIKNIDIITLSIAYILIPQDTSHVTVARTPSVLHVLRTYGLVLGWATIHC